MATIKYLSLDRLTEYDALIKAEIIEGDEAVLTSAKSYTDEIAANKSDTSHNHDDVYYTETEIDTKLSEINTSITNITNGTTVVGKATSATTAESANAATKSTQDASGNIITSTYETKSDATAKLESANAYTDTAIANLVNGAPETLNTLDEIAAALNDNADIVDVLNDAIGAKANASDLTSHTSNTSNPHGVTLAQLGVTATATELNHMSGVTFNIQTQLDDITDAKADWNQNDSTQLNFIKNRPFYTADPIETVIAEGTIPINGSMQVDASVQSLTLGESYTVIFDGTSYENLICENIDGLPAIGASDSSYTDYPFIFAIQSGTTIAIAGDNTTSHSIKVIAYLSSIIPLERKYIAEYIDTFAGEKVEGKTYTVDGSQVTAAVGAEVFNDYSTNIASGRYSHAEGLNNVASGILSHAEGWSTKATGGYAHTEGRENTASGSSSHAEGWSTEATNDCAHAEGFATNATGQYSHAEGDNATASGRGSHAEGYLTDATGNYSHAEGYGTVANSRSQHVQGDYNVLDTENANAHGTYAHIVGNGADINTRSNAHTLDWEGNAWFAGDVYVGSTSGTNKDEGSKILATQEYVDIRVPVWTETDEGKFLRIVNGTPTWSTVTNTEEVRY